MIKNPRTYQKFQDDFTKSRGNLTHKHSLRLFTAMWKEARALDALPSEDPLEGIAVDIKIAKVLNSCLKNSSPE